MSCLPVCSQDSKCTVQALSNHESHAELYSDGVCSVHLLLCIDTQPETTSGYCLSALANVSWPCGSVCARIKYSCTLGHVVLLD